MTHFNYYLETLLTCGQVAFVDTLSYVNKIQSQLHSFNIKMSQISRNKIQLGQMYQVWIILDYPIDPQIYATRRLALIQSGLIHLWHEWKNRVEFWNDTVKDAKGASSFAKAISIRDNIVVVYYVDLSLKAICLLFFVIEWMKYHHNALIRLLIFVLRCLLKLPIICLVGTVLYYVVCFIGKIGP